MASIETSSREEGALIIRPLLSLAEHRGPASWYARPRQRAASHHCRCRRGECRSACAVELADRHRPHALVIAALEARELKVAQMLLWRGRLSGTTAQLDFFDATPVAKQSLAASTDLASAIALIRHIAAVVELLHKGELWSG